ncbi:hypothetical protein [Christiangramia crocea]|uniref:Uncharacterized protein n=1 Tax=Christiangramia crocea TaxID=2904124 RepID=A0A9X1UVR9_9FLAO|nr:hypothetical protein [Gramella crocea]MCG9970976.1 hypothetical protein [Gramella crocea]
MIFLNIFLVTVAVLWLCLEFANFMTYGGFINKSTEEALMNLNESKLRLNPFNPSILSGSPYISTHNSLFSKYHIEGFGVVPKWSKLHKRIEEYYAIAIQNNQ